MAEQARALQIRATSQAPESRFRRYLDNRATFSTLRRILRRHHFSSFRDVPQGSVYSQTRAYGGNVGVSIARSRTDGQTISLSDGEVNKTIHVEHPTLASRARNFMKALPLCALAVGTTGAILSSLSGAIPRGVDLKSVLLGAAAATVLRVLVREVRSITNPFYNLRLYDLVRGGDWRAISAIKSHLESEEFFPSRIKRE